MSGVSSNWREGDVSIDHGRLRDDNKTRFDEKKEKNDGIVRCVVLSGRFGADPLGAEVKQWTEHVWSII